MKRYSATLLLFLLVSACAPQRLNPSPLQSPGSKTPVASMFLANFYGPAKVAAFRLGDSHPSSILRTRKACETISDLAADGYGTLFASVTGCSRGSIAVYRVGSTRPYRRLTTGDASPLFVKTDIESNLYVSSHGNANHKRGQVTEFSAGEFRVLRTITDGVCDARRPDIDSSGNLYVANEFCGPNGNGSVTVYAPGRSVPFRTIVKGVFHPIGADLDQSGWLYVINFYNDTVTVYPPGKEAPLRTLHLGGSAGSGGPVAVGFDSHQNVYVAVSPVVTAGGSIYEFSPGGRRLINTISDQIQNPVAVSIDSADELYVANDGVASYNAGWISVYGLGQRKARRLITDSVDTPTAMLLFDR